MDNDIVKRLMWGGLLAGVGALATIVSTKLATLIWVRVFGEDPSDGLERDRTAFAGGLVLAMILRRFAR